MFEESGDSLTKSLEGLFDKPKVIRTFDTIGTDLVRKMRELSPDSEDPEGIALKDSFTHKVLSDGDRVLLIVGPKFPEAAHAHLVEDGFVHPSGGPVEGKKIMAKAVQSRASQTEKEVGRVT